MQPNYQAAASHGFFLNFSAVLLKLCGPFMDISNPNFWKRVDDRYRVSTCQASACSRLGFSRRCSVMPL